jgi:2-phosphosulfolactate phosphatase
MPQPLSVDAVFLPRDLLPSHTQDKSVAVFDVLRATTSIAAALAVGVAEIRIFPDTDSAARAAAAYGQNRILCGEVNCLAPPGFDLGNSPRAFTRSLHAGATAFLSTTNGTRAIIAARRAPTILTGAIVNATAVARALARFARPITLVCAGTAGQPALEDLIGAGAVLNALLNLSAAVPSTDDARIALRQFQLAGDNLRQAIAESTGARNLIAVGLDDDIDFCARLDSIPVVGQVLADRDNPPRVIALRNP